MHQCIGQRSRHDSLQQGEMGLGVIDPGLLLAERSFPVFRDRTLGLALARDSGCA